MCDLKNWYPFFEGLEVISAYLVGVMYIVVSKELKR